MTKPKKHHYLPVFLLKRWAVEGKVTEFRRRYAENVVPKRYSPQGTAYIERLYSIEGLPDDVAQELEHDYLSPVDSRAADALVKLSDDDGLHGADRRAWANFVASLLVRMPADIRLLRKSSAELVRELLPIFGRVIDLVEDAEKRPNLQEIGDSVGFKFAVDHIRQLMSHERLRDGLEAMRWGKLTFATTQDLLISDRPVMYTGLGGSDALLIVPIGPKEVFTAYNDQAVWLRLKQANASEVVSKLNMAVVGGANSVVFGRDEKQLRFIQNRLGKNREKSIVEHLIELQQKELPSILATLRSVMQAELMARADELRPLINMTAR
jgi:hypothetical protein